MEAIVLAAAAVLIFQFLCMAALAFVLLLNRMRTL
jgi:hypothetical protein